MPIPKEKSKKETCFGKFSTLIYGANRIGKTIFASHYPDAIFLLTEPGTNSVEVYESFISSWEAFIADCKELTKEENKQKFKTIVIDTIDNLYKFCQEYVLKLHNIKHESDMPYGKGFSLVNNEFQKTITKLSLLPYGLVFISHSQEKEVDTRLGKVKKVVPTLPEAARKIVMNLVDNILYFDIEPLKDDDNGKIRGYQRVIRTKTNPYYEAGCRTKGLKETIELDYTKFVEEFSRALEKENEG